MGNFFSAGGLGGVGNIFADYVYKQKNKFGLQARGGSSESQTEYNKYSQKLGDMLAAQLANSQTNMANINDPLIAAQSRVQGLSGRLSGLPDALRTSALASSAPAALAAVQAGRLAAGGRGGLAYGGGGAQTAARAAGAVSADQSAALANALSQGLQANANYDLQVEGMNSGLAGGIQQGEQFKNAQLNALRAQLLGSLGGIAGGFGQQGLVNENQLAEREHYGAKKWFDMWSNIGSFWGGGGGMAGGK